MNNLAVFYKSAEIDDESESLRDLLDFMEKPHSIGLDSLKESLRNIVQLMMELKGYDTGYALQHLMFGEHSSLSMEGLSKEDRKKKKKLQEFLEDMNEIIREMAAGFSVLFTHTHNIIVEIKESLDEQIADIDAVIEEKADTKIEADALKAKSSKRRKLVKFKKHIKNYKEELQEVDSSREVMEIQKNVIEDVEDFKDEVFVHGKPKPKPLGILGGAIVAATVTATAINDYTTSSKSGLLPDKGDKNDDKNYPENKIGDSSDSARDNSSDNTKPKKNKIGESSDSAGDSSSASSSNGDTTSGDSSSSGEDGKREDTKPDLPNFDL